MPKGFSDRLSAEQLQLVISHECSHLAAHDLSCELLIEFVSFVLWPHPLVWRLPDLHRAACDLRCDAIAARRDFIGYRKMLAELALNLSCRSHQLLAMSFATRLDIMRRVDRLQNSPVSQSLTGRCRLAAAALLCLMCVAGTIGINGYADEVDLNATNEVKITVLNEKYEPNAGDEVRVEGLRTKKEPGRGHGNRLQTTEKTSETGVARVKYPRYVLEEIETGQLILTVTHSEYSLKNIQSYDLESQDVILLEPGRRLTVNAIDSTSGDLVTQGLHALLPGRAASDVWTHNNDSTRPRLTPRGSRRNSPPKRHSCQLSAAVAAFSTTIPRPSEPSNSSAKQD